MKKSKKIMSAILSVCIVLSAFMALPVGAESIDLSQSLISGVNPNSVIVYDELYSTYDSNETDNSYAWSGNNFSQFTDGDSTSIRSVSPEDSARVVTESNDTFYIGKFKYVKSAHDGWGFRNQGEELDIYYDIVFSLDAKTGKPVEVSQFYLSGGADSSSLYKYEVYFSNSLSALSAEESCAINYVNDDASQYDFITLEKPVTAVYMMVRVTMGVQPVFQWNETGTGLNIAEVAVFGNANPNIGYNLTTGENIGPAENAESSLIYNIAENSFGISGVYNPTASGNCVFPQLTDATGSGENFAPGASGDIGVTIYTSNKILLNQGNKLEAYDDFVYDLTKSTKKSAEISSFYFMSGASSDFQNYKTYQYAVYFSDSLETLDSAESIKLTFTNFDGSRAQYFTFNEPFKASYMMVRIIAGVMPINISDDGNNYARISEIAVFGNATDDYNVTENPENVDLNSSLIHGQNNYSVGFVTDNDSTYYNNAYAALTDGDISVGHTDIGGTLFENNSPRYLYNYGASLDRYTDIIYNLSNSDNKTASINSVYIAHSTDADTQTYKYEIYASKTRDALGDAQSLKATFTNADLSSEQLITFAEPIEANYIMLRVTAAVPTSFVFPDYSYVRLREFAVFGSKIDNTYTVENSTLPEQDLFDSITYYTLADELYSYDDGIVRDLKDYPTKYLVDADIAGHDINGSALYFDSNGKIKNLTPNLRTYYDYVLDVSKLGEAQELKTIHIQHLNVDGDVLCNGAYEVYAADTKQELGTEESLLISYNNNNAAMSQTFTLNETVSAKYLMIRFTMGTQENAMSVWGYDVAYLRLAEVAVFGDKSYYVGDVNCDGSRDVRDLVRYKKYIVDSRIEFGIDYADINCDEKFNAIDLASLRKYLLNYNDKPMVYALGDSITEGFNHGNKTHIDLLSDMYGLNFENESVSGSTIAKHDAEIERPSFVERVVNFPENGNPDVFVTTLTPNDAFLNRTVGSISDSYSMADFDIYTTIGALEYILAYAKENWDCPVVIYTYHDYAAERYSTLVNLLYELQSKWGFTIVNINDGEKLMGNITEEQYSSCLQVDKVHLTTQGYYWYADCLSSAVWDAIINN